MKTEIAFDCPWCAGQMVSTDLTTGNAADALACATCSIVVELAPDPAIAPVALAA
jgi:transcription elongation factor Elf1